MSNHYPQRREPDTDTVGKKVEEKLRQRSDSTWQKWGIILLAITTFSGLTVALAKSYWETPLVLSEHQKSIDLHGVAISDLQKTAIDRDSRLIRMEDKLDNIQESIRELKGSTLHVSPGHTRFETNVNPNLVMLPN